MSLKLMEHQEKAVRLMGDGKILAGDTGSGKTYAAIEYYMRHHFPCDVYVITTAKKRDVLDWQMVFAKLAIGTEREFSDRGALLTVDSWNNITDYVDVENAFFIFDEQRVVGYGSWVRAFLKIAKKNKWIMLSATPGDKWLDYVPVFIANGFFRNKTEFTDNHVVWSRYSPFPKVERYIGERRLERMRKRILVEMPFERHTTQHSRLVFCEYDQELFDTVWKKRWDPFKDKPIRTVGQMCYVARKVCNSDLRRLKVVVEKFEKHPRMIIFYNFGYEIEILRTLKDILNVPFAEYNGQKHEDVPEGDRWIYAVNYMAASEAWDCITTDYTMFYSLNYSYKMRHQAKGRIDRLNTPYNDLYYDTLLTKSVMDKAIWDNIKAKKNFNEKSLKIHFGKDL